MLEKKHWYIIENPSTISSIRKGPLVVSRCMHAREKTKYIRETVFSNIDSTLTKTHTQILSHLRTYLFWEQKYSSNNTISFGKDKYPAFTVASPRQRDCYSCGWFCIANAEKVLTAFPNTWHLPIQDCSSWFTQEYIDEFQATVKGITVRQH